MTTVTLHADEELLARATEAIARREMTLDQVFERALREVAGGEARGEAERDKGNPFLKAVREAGLFYVGDRPTRDELNER